MTRIDAESLANIKLTLDWQDSAGQHSEMYDAFNVNFWRDVLPRELYHELMGKRPGDEVNITFEAGVPLVGYHPRSLFTINKSQFNLKTDDGRPVSARVGRYYPKGILRNVTGVFPQNREPFRCVQIENGHLMVDFNHPLVERKLFLKAEVQDVFSKPHERGGSSIDWIEHLSNGPGMQSRWRNQPTDFFSPDEFERIDMSPDERFYVKPRLVHHIDVTARRIIEDLYGRLLSDRSRVLDLMSSWASHLPENLTFDRVAGVGLNSDELSQNIRLDDRVIHDLNRDHRLPFETESFDAVICTVSIEYLADPLAVFKEVGRVLTPGGLFIVTFSNRWFAPKAINIWPRLHEFERVGLVKEYFLRSDIFNKIDTLSRRGQPRDSQDKYFGQIASADPVYAVWGYKEG